MNDEIQRAMDRAKALEHVRRVLEEVKLKIAWMDQVLDHENNMLAAAHNCLEIAEISLVIDLKAHLQAHKLKVGPGNDREPVRVILWDEDRALGGTRVPVAFG